MRHALPEYHIRPGYGWLNDPNGVTRYGDRWHVFFQHNAAAPVHGNIQWGHVSSSDLASWTEHPVAFGPTAGGPDAGGCWSGVFARDLGRPALVYSGIAGETPHSTVCLRWGSPDLLDWSDPIVVAETPTELGVVVMRDPYVFTFEGRRWALLGAELEGREAAVLRFSCDDILAWRYEGIVAQHSDPVLDAIPEGEIWECPQLIVDGDAAALVVSVQRDRQLEEVMWAVGRLESESGAPHFVASSIGELDHGRSFYAPQIVADDGGALCFGWVRELERHPAPPPVAGCLTLPRRLRIAGQEVVSDVDPGVVEVLTRGGETTALATGRHTVSAGRVVVSGPALLSAEGDPSIQLDLPAGGTVWLDADVAEAFVDGDAPTTRRGLGDWVLDLPDGSAAALTEVRAEQQWQAR